MPPHLFLGIDLFWSSAAASIGRCSQLLWLRAEAIFEVARAVHPGQSESTSYLSHTT